MPRPRTLPALTSLRFAAALCVVLYHSVVRTGRPVDSLLSIGFVSVPFFFLLSGFILGHVYLSQGKAVPVKRFFVSRFARIYPLYAATLLFDLPRFLHVSATVTHLNVMWRASTVLASFAMLQGWNQGLTSLNPPSWSLSAEAFFYLLFPFLGPALFRLHKRWVLPLIVLMPFVGLAMTSFTDPASAPTYDPLRPLPTFIMGILLSRWANGIHANQVQREWLERSVPFVVLLCMSLLLASTRLASHHALLQNGLLAPVFALLILSFTVQSRLATLFSAKWLVLLGEASFGLYLIHMPVKALLRAPLERHFALIFPFYLATVVLMSVGSFLYFETPARVWVLSRFEQRTPETLLTSSIAQ